MPDDTSNDTIDRSLTDGPIQAVPDSSSPAEHSDDWASSLWDDGWEGQTGQFGQVHVCVATKKWGDGTEDVLVAHNPYDDGNTATAYAHRHGQWVTPLTIHGPANEVVKTVTSTWGPPQQRETEFHGS